MRLYLQRLGFVIGIGLALSGCQEMFDVDMPNCWADSDCSGSNVCLFNHCSSIEENRLTVAAKLVPVPSSGHVVQQLPSIDLNGSRSIDVTLLEAVEVQGTITLAGHGFAAYNVPGSLEARSPGDIPGHDYWFTTRSLEGLNENGYGYSLRLLPGREYTFKFKPDDPTIPVHTWTHSLTAKASAIHDIKLPSNNYQKAQGFVRFTAVEAVTGAHVTAISETGSTISSVETDLTKGFFELSLPPGATKVRFKVKPGPASVVFPEHMTKLMDVSEELVIWLQKPDHPPVDVALKVSAKTDTGLAEGVPETTVTLATSDGKLRQSVTTDAYGVANFKALPGAYDVAICPNPGSDHASFMGSINLAEGESTPQIELSRRVEFRGKVFSSSGGSISSGHVFLHHAQDEAASKTSLITPAPFSIVIGSNGEFEANVDPGTYTLRVIPGGGIDAPPINLPNVDIEWDQELDIQLPPLDLVHLRVLNPAGEPVPDVSVELYVTDAEADTVNLLSVTPTNHQGGATLMVPLAD